MQQALQRFNNNTTESVPQCEPGIDGPNAHDEWKFSEDDITRLEWQEIDAMMAMQYPERLARAALDKLILANLHVDASNDRGAADVLQLKAMEAVFDVLKNLDVSDKARRLNLLETILEILEQTHTLIGLCTEQRRLRRRKKVRKFAVVGLGI
jgi:hypothetical protein